MRYLHKTSITGLFNLLFDWKDGLEICLSTEKSSMLLGQGWRDVCIIINTDIDPVAYSDSDIDSLSRTEWDEARIIFPSKENLIDAISNIIVSKESLKKIRGGRYDNLTLPGKLYEVIEASCFTGRSSRPSYDQVESKALKSLTKGFYNDLFRHNFGIVSETQARKIDKSFTSYFLNL